MENCPVTISLQHGTYLQDDYDGICSSHYILYYLRFVTAGVRNRPVWGTRSSMLDWVLDAGLSCTKGVWYIYDWDTG